jgi:16S rRNA (cytosine1402-N4)-methyltransferase
MEGNTSEPHKRRKRYKGTHPHSFSEKYKELNPERYAADVAHVLSRGDTPAGSHRSICVREIIGALAPKPGETALDATLGYGGHSREILRLIQPGGRLFGTDVDPIELPKTVLRLRAEGFGPETFITKRINFADIATLLAGEGIAGFDMILADLGVSSMQIDDPSRGFMFKRDGPLDMRMDPGVGLSAAGFLLEISEGDLEVLLTDNADEPEAGKIAREISAQRGGIATTRELSDAVRTAYGNKPKNDDETRKAIRRTFQAIRVAVNGEFTALDRFLAALPACLLPGGRVAILTFHSGEERRVERAFGEPGIYSSFTKEAIRPSQEERYANPRSSAARLRWAVRS